MRLCDIKRRQPLTFEEALKVLKPVSGVTMMGWDGAHLILNEDLHVFKQARFWKPRELWGYGDGEKVIVNLIIPRGSRIYIGRVRMQGVHYKVRASQAMVHSIANFQGKEKDIAYALYDRMYSYKPGKLKRPEKPFYMGFNECGSGIHFFLDIGSALQYNY
jgi:hypothetical protein